jgi:MFS family permease
MLTSRLIQVILLMFTMLGICSGGLVEVALPALVHGPMHGGARGYGIILAGWSAGSLVGSICAGMLGKLKHRGLIIMVCGLVVGAAIGLLPTWGIVGAVACMLIGGVANSAIVVLLFTAIQLAIPRHLMGRVMGVLMFSSFGLYPVSVALAGVLSNQFGPAILFPFGGLLIGLVMLFGMTQKEVREI